MADLTHKEKARLEELFEMRSGYVLTFSNRAFVELVADSVGRDIMDAKYNLASGSKANRLRSFWKEEPNHVAGNLVHELIRQCPTGPDTPERLKLLDDCQRIAIRLQGSASVDALGAISADGLGPDFEVLAKTVREAIEKNTPLEGLDRLHTYVFKVIRTYAERHGVSVERDKPIHSVYGEYVRALHQEGLVESEMITRILGASGKLMEPFNDVRNKKSLAHDNATLDYDESLVVFNQICGVVRFLRALEAKCARPSMCLNDDATELSVGDMACRS